MNKIKRFLQIISLVFIIFLSNFNYLEARSRSSGGHSSGRVGSSSRSHSSSSSRTHSSTRSHSSSSSNHSPISPKISQSKSSSSSSSSSSKNRENKSTSKTRSSLSIDDNKNYKPKESKNIKAQTINNKKVNADNIEEVLREKNINTTTTRKYYYPYTYRSSIFDNPFVKYYLVYNLLEDTVEMVTDRKGYKDDQVLGVVSNENGQDEIIMFENEKPKRNFFSITKIIIYIFVGIIIFVLIKYFSIFRKKK